MATDTKYVCVSIPESQQREFDDALSDIICWMDGYQAAGGHYSPGSLDRLRAIRTTIFKAYHTISPTTEAMGQKEEKWPKYLRDGKRICRYDSETTGEWVYKCDGPTWWAYSKCIANGYKPIPSTQAEKILKKK